MSKKGLILLVLVAVVLVGYFVFKDQIIDFVRNILVLCQDLVQVKREYPKVCVNLQTDVR